MTVTTVIQPTSNIPANAGLFVLKPHRAAGYTRLLYLILASVGIMAEIIRSFMISTDPALTASRVRDAEFLFRLSFFFDLLMMLSFVFLGIAFYSLFKDVDRQAATLLLTFVMLSVPLHMAIAANQLALVVILTDAPFLISFEVVQIESLALLFYTLNRQAYLISQLFFGLWLLPLGYLVRKSGYFPSLLGLSLYIGGTSLIIDSIMLALAPQIYTSFSMIITILASVGELAFVVWLVFIGTSFGDIGAHKIFHVIKFIVRR